MAAADNLSRRSFLKAGAGGLGALSLAAAAGAQDLPYPLSAPDKVRIAVVQQKSVPGEVNANRKKALAFALKALEGGADIVLFHEELLVGYVENLRELAEPRDGTTSQAFQELLEGSQAQILWGNTERDGGKLHIAATLVGADGVRANYRKTHLWWNDEGLRDETNYYVAGNELVTFTVKGHKCGVMICYDGDFPEMTRAYANLGCSMLFWLNNRGQRGHDEVKPLAEANSMIMPTACVCGQNERGYKCRGGSNITNFDGELLAEIWDEEGVIFADADPAAALAAREKNPWYIGRRADLYCRYQG